MSSPFQFGEFQAEWCNDESLRCEDCPIPRLEQKNPDIAKQVVNMVGRFGLREVAEAHEKTQTQHDSYEFGMMVELSGKAVQEYPMEGYPLAVDTIQQIAKMHLSKNSRGCF